MDDDIENLEEKLKILPDSILIEFCVRFKNTSASRKYMGSEFVKDGQKLTEEDIALSECEIDLLYHESDEINFRGVRYVKEPGESGINGRGEPIKRIKYRLSHKSPPIF